MFGPVLPALAAGRRVITVDLPGHGHTADPGRPLRYESMAEHIAALMAYLGLTDVDVMGYSLGGGAALRLAIQQPGLVRRLVLVCTPFRRDGWYPDILAAQSQLGPEAAAVMMQSPLYETYAQVAPRVQDWPLLISRLGELLARDYDWSAGLTAITAPVMLVFADADSIFPAHMVEFFALLGGGLRDAGWDGASRPRGQLAILPGTTHYDISVRPALAEAVIPFLDAAVFQPVS